MVTTVRGVGLPEPMWEALQREATTKGITASELIRDILAQHLKERQ